MRQRDSGFVVVLSLVVAAALALVALQLGSAGRGHAIDAHAAQQRLEARLAAEGAIERALFLLGRPEDAFEASVIALLRRGGGARMEVGDASVALIAVAGNGLIDLNDARPEVLEGLFEELGLPPSGAEALKRALLDRRGYFGQEARPLRHQAELLSMPGVDQEAYRRLLPLVTLFGSSSIDPTTAPAAVLAALPGLDRYSAESLVAFRLGGSADAEQLRDRAPSEARAYLRGEGGATYVLRARVHLERGGAVVVERAVAGRRYDDHLVFRTLQQWTPPSDAAWEGLDAPSGSAPF